MNLTSNEAAFIVYVAAGFMGICSWLLIYIWNKREKTIDKLNSVMFQVQLDLTKIQIQLKEIELYEKGLNMKMDEQRLIIDENRNRIERLEDKVFS